MCIAIYKPAGYDVEEEKLKIAQENNPDGCGFAYINVDNNGTRRIKIRKSMDYEGFLSKYKKALKDNPDSPFIIHFRIKTQGKVDIDNCHPFRITKDLVFMHNGIITGLTYSKFKSDTRMFNEEILRTLPKDWINNKAVKFLIEDFIGNSKLVFMDVNGKVRIFNEGKGHWKDGVWFSNKSYEPKPLPVVTNTKTSTVWKPQTQRTVYQIPSRTNVYNKNVRWMTKFSRVPCSQCNDMVSVESAKHYYVLDEVESYCKFCKTVYSDNNNLLAPEQELTVDCALDYFNETDYYTYEDSLPVNRVSSSKDYDLIPF